MIGSQVVEIIRDTLEKLQMQNRDEAVCVLVLLCKRMEMETSLYTIWWIVDGSASKKADSG